MVMVAVPQWLWLLYCSGHGCSTAVIEWVVLQWSWLQYCSGLVGGTAEVMVTVLQWLGGWYCSGWAGLVFGGFDVHRVWHWVGWA